MNEPLLFLPGMMCDARLFAPQIGEFSVDYPVMVAPLTGRSTVAELCEDILAHAPPRFALAGLSMGGIIAMEIVRQKNQLDSSYSKLWDSFDAYIHIKGPGFGTVFDWRKQQEASNLKVDEDDLPKERINWLSEFIQHYQRLTIAMGNKFHRSGAIISIDKDRTVINFDLTNF